MKLEFYRQIFEKKNLISDFVKVHPVGVELFHADGRTGVETATTKLIVTFRNSATASADNT